MNNTEFYTDVLGVEYEVKFCTSKEQPKFKSLGAAGLCEPYEHTLYINIEDMGDEDAFANEISYYKQVIRHEYMHAMFFECGLTDYMRDETLVEFLACIYPKMGLDLAKTDLRFAHALDLAFYENTGWRTFDEKDVTTWPEFNEKVLVLSSNQEFFVREFYVSQGLPFWTDGDTIIANHSIKAWMPIPEPYQEDT